MGRRRKKRYELDRSNIIPPHWKRTTTLGTTLIKTPRPDRMYFPDAEEEEGVIATHPAAAHHLPEALRLALGDAVNLHLLARQSMRLILRNDPSFAASWLRGLRRGISESSLKRIWARILSRM